ncbi:MAG: hypothetical protein JXA44_04605 [Methanospirillaceae archaeon]|nr:hypothetical protein [Methanospirillaceae archaeon]
MKRLFVLMICIIVGVSCTGCMNRDVTGLDSIPQAESDYMENAESLESVPIATENQSGYEGPYSFSGSGYANTPHFYLTSGPATFEMTMSGKYYNGAILYDSQYIYITGLVDQNSAGTIKKTVEISTPGEYFIGMNAPDNSWTVTIRQ